MPALDEFALIDVFLSSFVRVAPPVGPGDDCSVVPLGGGRLCVTTDAVVEGVHFTRRVFSLEDVGHKALAVNLSDLAAMGARPTWALCALGLPAQVHAAQVRALGRGMAALARTLGVPLLGGNVTRARELSLTVTVGGEVPLSRRPLLRSGARPGDVLYVSGPLGLAAAGVQVLKRPRRPEAWQRVLARAQQRPAPHVALGLAAAPFASAAIDVSDGLLQDLGHLCTASRVGAEVDSGALPMHPALRRWARSDRAAKQLALAGGEDYVLLLAVPERRVDAFEDAMARKGYAPMPIGLVTRRRGLRVDGKPARGHKGFTHF